jgi:hypothetical protein
VTLSMCAANPRLDPRKRQGQLSLTLPINIDPRTGRRVLDIMTVLRPLGESPTPSVPTTLATPTSCRPVRRDPGPAGLLA